MNYINHPKSFIKYDKIHTNDYNFNFLKIIENHINTDLYIIALHHLDIYLLKNIWNSIVKHWSTLQKGMINRKDKNYLNSEYSSQKYNHIHTSLTAKELNDLINQFINKDKFKAIFTVNCMIVTLG